MLAQDLHAGDRIAAGTVLYATLFGGNVVIRLEGGGLLLAHYNEEVK